MPRALISVTDKSGLIPFAQTLVDRGFELVSTGGTATALREAGLRVIDVSEVTGFPEMLDGRLKTLHPLVHGGLLGDLRKPAHGEAMAANGIVPIDLLVVNLYAFEQTVTNEHTEEGAIESIDIGGPAMIRAAAKNSANVLVVVDPGDYDFVADALLTSTVSPALRKKLMAKAFRHTAFYDSMIARYLTGGDDLVETYTVGYRRSLGLRYGENPHQDAALYIDPLADGGIARARQLWGKELSYNNLLDGDAAWALVCDLATSACAIIKHGNPCGVARGASLGDSYRIARESDPISAFGGIAAFHGPVTLEAAEAMTKKGNFLEVVIGTAFEPAATKLFQDRSGWGQNVRLLEATPNAQFGKTIRSIGGGALIQDADRKQSSEWKVVTQLQPTPEQLEALKFQWTVARHVKSNAIVVGLADRLLGVGAGQMNRVQSVRLALEQAGEGARGAVLASDAFFPFPDSIETAAAAGIAAVIQPGGSKKDDEVIQAADRLGIAMIMTGVRHFRH